MRPDMDSQGTALDEALAAVIAGVRSCIRMDPFMPSEIRFTQEELQQSDCQPSRLGISSDCWVTSSKPTFAQSSQAHRKVRLPVEVMITTHEGSSL